MKKKLIAIFAIVALVAILAICLVACNPYKWDSIGAGQPDAEVESNGGMVVKQGKYLYYVNGYAGSDADNSWGTPVKQAIVRCELDENGAVKEGTHHVVVPKLVHGPSSSALRETGFAIYGNWIYYATINTDLDNSGNPSTTDLDFMRTTLDGSVTQIIGRISDRSARFIFTPSRVLYFSSSTISYLDFSSLNDKPNKNGKGVQSGTLAEGVSSVMWAYGIDRVYYTKTISGDDSYKHYGELCSVRYDGSDARTIATRETFLSEEGKQHPELNPTSIFKYNLVNIYKESDGSVTLYYTKTYSLNSSDTQVGLFCFNDKDGASIVTGEKKLNGTGGSSVTLYPLGYEDGAIVSASNGNFWQNGSTPASEGVQVTSSSNKIWFVYGEYAYYGASSLTELYKVKYKERGNSESIISESINTSFMQIDFIGTNMYFVSTTDDNYLHTIDLLTFDKNAKDEDGELIGSTYVGFPREDEE